MSKKKDKPEISEPVETVEQAPVLSESGPPITLREYVKKQGRNLRREHGVQAEDLFLREFDGERPRPESSWKNLEKGYFSKKRA